MDDLIPRKAVIGALKASCIELGGSEWGDGEMGVHRDDIEAVVNSISTFNASDRNVGKWIYGESEIGNDGYYCSVCGNFVPWKYDEYDIDFIKEFLFCNNCGADMREGDAE